LRWLESERRSGRKLYLCTAANLNLAERIASHLGLFDGVFASSERLNLAGRAKGTRLVQQFGKGAFDYCGNERKDLEVWALARGAVVVRCGARLEKAAARLTPIIGTFRRETSLWRALIRALHPQKWLKNLLVLLPLLTAQGPNEPELFKAGLLAAVAFCLCASCLYIVNDLLDLELDRTDVRTSTRPFAAGDLPLTTGLALAAALLLIASVVAALLPVGFQATLGSYLLLAVLYSLFLKGIVVIDVIALTGLSLTRIFGGAVAADVSLPPWILPATVPLFLCFAMIKRHASRKRHADRDV
jgi:hypothetical protein